MPFRPCVSGCGRYLAPGDSHDRCLSCLGIEHAEAAFVDESCPHCGGMTVAGLRTRLRFLQRGGVLVPLPRSKVPPGGYRGEATSGSIRTDLTVTVRNSPTKTARAPPVTGTSLPMELPREWAGPSHGGGVPLVSFGAPPDDWMSIATSEGESDQSGDDGSVPLPPSGRSAVPDSDPEMVAMLARAAESFTETTVRAADAPILRAEIAVLLAKDAIEPVPPADMRSGFYSPYFIVPKKGGGLRPILDLRVLNRALHRLPFKMLTPKRIFGCVRPQDWFAAIDLKDAYFHVSILPRHRPFLRFAFEGRAYQYKVLPFGLSLSPRVFTKVAEAALVPLREQGVRILNYLDDWLILAQSRDQLCEHRDMVLSHLSQLGLQVNWEKSKLSPVQRISFLGMELDSVSQTARLTQERTQSVLNCLNTFTGRRLH